MNWKEKMEYVLDRALQDEPLTHIYKVELVSGNEFSILRDGEKILNRKSINSIESHWRYEVTKAIEILTENKILKALSEI